MVSASDNESSKPRMIVRAINFWRGWILVTEALPDWLTMVMCYGPATGLAGEQYPPQYWIGMRHDGNWWSQNDDQIIYPTHWKPLPKIPEI